MSQATEQERAQSPDQQQQDGQQQDQQHGRSLAEWVSFGIAATILLGVAGLVLFYWLTVPLGPAVISISPLDEIREVGEQFYVPFVVGNGGGNTAASVQLIGEVRMGGEVVEQSQLQINYLAGGEQQQGVFVFRHDPRAGEMLLRIGGYQQP
jgi:uncharacterized protein (TIGR02588 family)